MNKDKLLKLLQRKTYWEKERDKCFLHIFFYYVFVVIICVKTSSDYSGIKKINQLSWSNASGWDRFSCIFDWVLIVSFAVHMFVAIYYLVRIQVCSSKLVEINQQLLAELKNYPVEFEQTK